MSTGATTTQPQPSGSPIKRLSSKPDRGAEARAANSNEVEDERQRVWEGGLARAEQTLTSYLEWARYPPESRPMRERPDLARPHHVSARKLPLSREDRKLTDAKVTLYQDRYYVAGDESIQFTIGCETSEGLATCQVLKAMVNTAPDMVSTAGPKEVVFSDGEHGGVTASFQPKTQGFVDYQGPLRLDVMLNVAGEAGGASFDFEYTPRSPAMWTGAVRDELEEGSLVFYVGIQVTEPGRYVIKARVDDDDDKSFAYLSFNDVLDAGEGEIRLRLFGKLIHDEQAKPPFGLRDIEGFLLKEDTYPDRETMPAWEGIVYKTKRYATGDFSDREWESAEKARHIQEFTKDVERSQDR